jgi:hypothetical protein
MMGAGYGAMSAPVGSAGGLASPSVGDPQFGAPKSAEYAAMGNPQGGQLGGVGQVHVAMPPGLVANGLQSPVPSGLVQNLGTLGTVMMQAPSGERQAVPAALAQHYAAKGAWRVS